MRHGGLFSPLSPCVQDDNHTGSYLFRVEHCRIEQLNREDCE